MDVQQIIAFGMVSLAGFYLGRQAFRALRDWRTGRAGCVKCGFAQPGTGFHSTVPHHRRHRQIPLTPNKHD